MEIEEKTKEKDLRKVRDSIYIGLKCCELRGKRLGVSLTLADVCRLGLDLIYSGELEILRMQNEGKVFDCTVEELS